MTIGELVSASADLTDAVFFAVVDKFPDFKSLPHIRCVDHGLLSIVPTLHAQCCTLLPNLPGDGCVLPVQSLNRLIRSINALPDLRHKRKAVQKRCFRLLAGNRRQRQTS